MSFKLFKENHGESWGRIMGTVLAVLSDAIMGTVLAVLSDAREPSPCIAPKKRS